MKKRKISIERKLSFNKATIASLNPAQQHHIEGGAPITFQINCQTRQVTCQTIPYTERLCRPCMD
ncbi:hypothetical protein ECE50_029080 [Chitinophaga sp. Mgbs1]|uniref:Class I lanthipeptide n=1 Tax=Chitinophaga solisilvae TaxID=1233460 RepID=A0A9Q5D4L9_9BACT|nr:hypothetical protein [Chitinophaga solisilvae]